MCLRLADGNGGLVSLAQHTWRRTPLKRCCTQEWFKHRKYYYNLNLQHKKHVCVDDPKYLPNANLIYFKWDFKCITIYSQMIKEQKSHCFIYTWHNSFNKTIRVMNSEDELFPYQVNVQMLKRVDTSPPPSGRVGYSTNPLTSPGGKAALLKSIDHSDLQI